MTKPGVWARKVKTRKLNRTEQRQVAEALARLKAAGLVK